MATMKNENVSDNPRYTLYKDIKEALEGMADIKYVDLWNENVDYIDEDSPWQRPAVFVEFDDISWRPVNGDDSYDYYLRGEGRVRLHIVTDWADGAQEQAMALSVMIWGRMMNVEAEDGRIYSVGFPSASYTNHNHDEILETIDEYAVKYFVGLNAKDNTDE